LRRFDMYVPEGLNDLLTYLDAHQSGVELIANGSDLINRIQRRQVNPQVLVDLSALSEFHFVKQEKGEIRIGALTTIQDLVSSPVLGPRYDVFRDVAKKFGGPSIVNVATVGGNICAASSSEDLIPVLLVLNAKMKMRSKQDERVMPLEDFLRGKRKTALLPNEIVIETLFEELDENSACSFEKIGMRNSLIIAFLNCSVYLKLDKKTRRVEEIRIALNRVTGRIPARATKTENALQGQILSLQLVETGMSLLKSELQLTSDFRVSREYRHEVAPVLFKRALVKCTERLGEKVLA
jgi:CO/xanthine dehydrogenase FAD-binding subunit